MNSKEDLLNMENVKLQFTENVVLQEVNLAVHRQERLVIIGRSGSGKSTILRLIIGILKPNAGKIRFKEKDLTTLKRNDLNSARQKMGMVYQYSALISSLTVRDNLALPLKELTHKTKQEIDQVVDEKLELVGMKDSKAQLPEELSGGMKKRVGIARALVMQPELLLFDEPSAGLDPITSSRIDELIINLTEQTKATSIVVTHEMESAFRIATRVAMLHEGKIIEDNVPEQFKKSNNPIFNQFLRGEIEGPLKQEK